MTPLIISNRLPITTTINNDEIYHEFTSGGLSTAIRSLNINFKWIGWNGSFIDSEITKEKVKSSLKDKGIIPLFFDKTHFNNYYNGFSNKIIWPLFHYLLDKVEYNKEYWTSYKFINNIFADSIMKYYETETNNDNDNDNIIWIHDYHLLLLPSLLRNKGFRGKIGFFLHIPFPSSEIFRTCPYSKNILEGLSGADIIGFHTYNYCRHFITSLERILDCDVNSIGEYLFDNRKVLVKTCPIGISPNNFKNILNTEKSKNNISLLKEHFGNTNIILSVDRLDYTKGILEKLETYEYFLEHYQKKQNTILYLILVPSREAVDQYQELLKNIEEKISAINGRYSTFSYYSPIHFLYQSVTEDELCALYYQSDIMLVTACRDGMNLVSFEYCICQENKKESGVLILSEFAGASEYLTGSIIINPNNKEETAYKLNNALLMNVTEKNHRMDFNNSYIKKYTNKEWALNFINDLNNYNGQRNKDYKLFKDKINKKFVESKNKYFFIDVDGTLVNFKNDPSEIRIPIEIKKILESLSNKNSVNVNIVSGRTIDSLEDIFNRDSTNSQDINLFGEHGSFYKIGKNDTQSPKIKSSKEWRSNVLDKFKELKEGLPGSWIETKNHAIAFHYREIPDEYLKIRLKIIKNSLSYLLYKYNLQLISGNKVLDILEKENNKSLAIKEIIKLQNISLDDLFIAIGDDTTDESMFEFLKNKNSLTFKVGKNKKTEAKYYIESPVEVSNMLEEFSSLIE